MKILARWAVAFLFLFLKTATAGEVTPYFQTIGMEQGLSHRKVNCVLQDKRGFLWFGTEDGLNRYDGRYFVHFKHLPNRAETISGNIISDLHEDHDGVIWITTRDGGMSRYDYRLPANQQFKQYRHDLHDPESIPENGLTKIVEDRRGNLWLGTSGHYVVRFNKQTGKFDIPVREGTRSILSLAMDKNDTLWVGRAGGGLLKINTKNLSYKSDSRYKDLYAPMPHVSIPSIFLDSKNQFWLGSWDKRVYRYSPKTGREEAFDPNVGIVPDDFVDFAEDKIGHIWMASKNSGVTVYDPSSGSFKHLRHDPDKDGSLSDDHVNAVFIDRDQVVWIATNNGVSMYNPLFSPFVKHELPDQKNDIQIYDFFKEADGKLLIGTSEGIFIKNKNAQEYEHRPLTYDGQKLAVTKFFLDKDGRFYIGTNYTLFLYDRSINKITALPNTSVDPVMKKLINSRVVSIVRDTLGGHPVLLVSPYGHYITYYDLVENKWVSRADSVKKILQKYNITDNLVRKFYKDSRNGLWLATFKSGLGQWGAKEGPVRYFANDMRNVSSLTSNDVFDIQEDRSNNLWISTYGGGVNFFNRKEGSFTHLTESSNLTEGMQLDSLNNLWMLCNGHVHKYDSSRKVYSCYDLPSLEKTTGLTGYMYKDQEGTIYAAGANYYVTFRPSDIARINHAPAIYFTDLKILGNSHSEYLQEKTVRLKYWQNLISIEYAAPEYTGDNLQYAYMLEGVDKKWVIAGKNNVAQYMNLRGGTYKFKVRATNWKGSYTNDFSEMTIIVSPPFWQTFWFWLLVVLVVSSLIYLVYRYRVNMLLKQQEIRNGIAQDLHDQIGSTLSSISVYSEVAKRYADQNQAVSLNNVLHTINETANDMVSEMGDIVWAINPKNDHLESVFIRLRKYAQPLCDASEIRFRLDYDPKLADINIGMKSRKNVFLIIKESINNAVKHSGCQNLDVYASLREDTIELMIKDDGQGFVVKDAAAELLTESNGLSNIRSRAEELNATPEMQSTPGIGTILKITFKINNDL